MAEVLGRRTCGQKIKAVIELARDGDDEGEPWWNHRGCDVAWKSSRGGDTATCYWNEDENATWKGPQQDETHKGRQLPCSSGSANEMEVETDDNAKRFTSHSTTSLKCGSMIVAVRCGSA